MDCEFPVKSTGLESLDDHPYCTLARCPKHTQLQLWSPACGSPLPGADESVSVMDLPLNHLHPRADDWALTRVRTATVLQSTPEASYSSSKAVISTQASDGNPLVGENPGASVQ